MHTTVTNSVYRSTTERVYSGNLPSWQVSAVCCVSGVQHVFPDRNPVRVAIVQFICYWDCYVHSVQQTSKLKNIIGLFIDSSPIRNRENEFVFSKMFRQQKRTF